MKITNRPGQGSTGFHLPQSLPYFREKNHDGWCTPQANEWQWQALNLLSLRAATTSQLWWITGHQVARRVFFNLNEKDVPMLCLSRTIGEQIEINCGDTTILVSVIEVRGDKVRLGIDAPREVRVHRKEVADRIRAEGEHVKPAKPPIVPLVKLGEKLPGQR